MRPWLPAASLLAGLLGVLCIATPANAAPADPNGFRHSSGLLVLPSADHELPASTPEPTAQLLADATTLAESAPADFAYPWVDAAGEVVVDTTTEHGGTLLSVWRPDERAAGAKLRNRKAAISMARFEQLRNDIVSLTSRVQPGQEFINQITPDGANNRLVLTVTKLDDALLYGLARRYGTSAIAVRYEPDLPSATNQSTRENDSSAYPGFFGGAHINPNNCTDAFSWHAGSTQYMLSAAHCYPASYSVSTMIESMGSVTASSRENWNPGVGTVYLTGQSVYRGDMALIQLALGKQAAGYIYSGTTSTSTATRPVKEMWSRAAAVGDQYCTGGRVTFENCGWVVQAVRFDQRLSSGEWQRNTNKGVKQGQCMLAGDSGGPLYTVRSDGGVAAKGIHNWGAGGGSDNWGGTLDPCVEGFTDIWDAFNGFPGALTTV